MSTLNTWLRLFSFPPEDLDFTLRPELYLTLVVDDEPEGSLAELWSRLRRGEPVELRSHEEWEGLADFMERRSINVSPWLARRLLDAGCILGRIDIEARRGLYRLHLRRAVPWSDYLPMGVYLVKQEAYIASEGLLVPEEATKETLQAKKAKRKR